MIYIQVPEVHRPILQQLRILFRDGREREVHASAPTAVLVRIIRRQSSLLDLDHRHEPDQPADRGSRPRFHARGLRILGQGHHESLLPREYGSHQSRFPPTRCRGRPQVFMILYNFSMEFAVLETYLSFWLGRIVHRWVLPTT